MLPSTHMGPQQLLLTQRSLWSMHMEAVIALISREELLPPLVPTP